ncbi:polyprenyl synthetase family protein [Rhodopirellula sp. JC740]|uniref:Polyprenyl synthetase family protein n=1 Tax=Rhodopirellula halodulae TaxID=2894198 RepID=A0ABS8NB58_9BACT|nr:farnesyl diphosphate synthase [Rhodopirellula sp. JC740]MCC9640801.1 polyprenyl synthetase family protein [Rhodopirellula sp. JC740]
MSSDALGESGTVAGAAEESLKQYMASHRPAVEAALAEACADQPGMPTRLAEAIRYAVLAPGKRLRPVLTIMAAEACGGSVASAMPAAVSVELIHAYSLIHDDLPAMDDDDLRRGRPTTHIEFDEATAILAGDALQSMAFAHLHCHAVDDTQAAAWIGTLAIAAGPSGLVGGQADDLDAEKHTVDDFGGPEAARTHLEAIHHRKTGALFTACAAMGAISAGADQRAVSALTNYARAFGLAFQITDDLLDCTSTDEQLGKRTGKDDGRGKLTYPGLMGLDRARAHAEAMIRTAHESLELFGTAGQRLRNLADFVLERTN